MTYSAAEEVHKPDFHRFVHRTKKELLNQLKRSKGTYAVAERYYQHVFKEAVDALIEEGKITLSFYEDYGGKGVKINMMRVTDVNAKFPLLDWLKS